MEDKKQFLDKVDNIALSARNELIDLIIDSLFKDNKVDGAEIKLDEPIELGGADSICKYDYYITHFKIYNGVNGEWLLDFYDEVEYVWDTTCLLTFNELYEICACLNN